MQQTWPDEPFARADLVALDRTLVDLRRGQRRGEIRLLVRGVWIAASEPDSIELRARAVARIVRPHHVVTDRTAAWLHGVDVHVRAEHVVGPPIETCALRGHGPTVRAGTDGRTRDLAPQDVMELHGVLVTTPLRTALDLGCHLRRREAYAAMNALARQHALSRDDFTRSVGRFRRRRGVIQLRELASLVEPRIESQRESWLFVTIHDAGLSLPEPQHWIVIDGVPTYRLDFAYPWLRVCVEYDGHDAHDGREAADEERRDWLRRNGWTVIVVREGGFTGDALDRWLLALRDALVPRYSNRRW
jgi:hypothetical protein